MSLAPLACLAVFPYTRATPQRQGSFRHRPQLRYGRREPALDILRRFLWRHVYAHYSAQTKTLQVFCFGDQAGTVRLVLLFACF